MAHKRHQATDTLEELASIGEHLTGWVSEHRVLATALAGSILVAAAAMGGYVSYESRRADQASTAVAALRDEFVTAMGGTPGSAQIPEPANPETARQVRLEFAERLLASAEAHAGTVAASLARLEAGDLLSQAGEDTSALDIWTAALEHTRRGALRGALLERVAVAHEEGERFAEAAEAHERASEIESYPLRFLALARAAWCRAEAGEPDRAVALYRRLRSVAPDLDLLPHVDARLRELEAAYGG